MPSDSPHTSDRVPTTRAVRHHLVVVILGLGLGAQAGWLYAASLPTTYTSTARVLVNPSVGNPFAPTPTAVRQDALTSLETEAQVARSTEVLETVARQTPALTAIALGRGLEVSVPPNTQILEFTYSGGDATLAQQVANTTASTYLANRARRSDEVNTARIDRVETQTRGVVTDLRTATTAAEHGTSAERLFQSQLATALRNELVSLRAQRTALENSDSPAGAVISPATVPHSATNLVAFVAPFGGALAGLALGCLIAMLLERFLGVVRTPAEVEELGLSVIASVPAGSLRARILRQDRSQAFDTTIRRLRASILEQDPRPDLIAVAPCGAGESQAEISEAVAESFARGGHRVVLVRTDGPPTKGGLVVEEGLAQALLYERLDVLELLLPSVEPLLCLLPAGGFTDQSRELLVAARVRSVMNTLVEAGNLVVIQSPGIDSAEGEAILGAADLGLVVVTAGRTRTAAVRQAAQGGARAATLAALVVGRGHAALRARLDADDLRLGADPRTNATAPHDSLARRRR